MARDIGSDETLVISNETKPSYKIGTKLTVYRSRSYFDTYVNDAPSFANPVNSSNSPIGENTTFSTPIEKFLTVAINEDGILCILIEGSATQVPLYHTDWIHVDSGCRPGIFCDPDDSGSTLVYWYRTTGWFVAILDLSLLLDNNSDCITDLYDFCTVVGNGAVYPTKRDAGIILTYDEGGILPVYVDSYEGDIHKSPSRFINPIAVIDPSVETDKYLVHFSGAAQIGNSVFTYFSYYDGSVRSIEYTLSSDGKNGSWSDIRISIPQDLSVFLVGNVFSHNGKIFICGAFQRKQEFETDTVWTLLSWSRDGITFSVDFRVLCTGIKLRFLAAYGAGNIFFSSTNRYSKQVAPYQVIGEDTTSSELVLINAMGSPKGEFTFKAISGKEEYFNIPYVDEGSYCRFDLGIFMGDDFSWSKYHDAVISRIHKEIEDGKRSFDLSIMPDGAWHTANMSYPFYMEFLGRESIYDKMVDFSNMYKLSSGIGPKWSLSCDFWVSDPKNHVVNGIEDYSSIFQVLTHNHTTKPGGTDSLGPDLKTFCQEYPVFGDDENYEIKIYGWSRAGVPDTNPNTADTTDTETLNDDFYALIRIENLDGSKETIVATSGQLTSAYKNPPQTYFEGAERPGSYPVTFSIPNPGAGIKILKLGCRVKAPGENTTYYLERAEMPGISVYLNPNGIEDAAYKVVKDPTSWKLVEVIDLIVTSGNSTNGNLTTGTFSPDKNKCYAAICVGAISFTRSGIDYLQSSHYETHSDIETQLQALSIESGDNPVFSKARVIWQDSLDPKENSNFKNYYLFHIDESIRELSTSIPNKYVPYFYGTASPFKVAFDCTGTGSISDISGNPLKIYIFESPENFSDFDHYSPIPSGAHWKFLIEQAYGDIGSHVVGGHYEHANATGPEFTAAPPLFIGPGYLARTAAGMTIKNENAFPIYMRADLKAFVRYTGIYQAKIDDSDTGFNPFVTSLPPESGDTLVWNSDVDNTVDITKHFTLYPDQAVESYLYLASTTDDNLFDTFNLEFTVMNFDSQVPVPSSFVLTIPSVVKIDNSSSEMTNTKKGIPQLLFSTTPYSAFNFESRGRFTSKGKYTTLGLIGLATDEKNYILGFIKPGKDDTQGTIGIAKIRDGKIFNIVIDDTIDLYQDSVYDVRFWHRDGLLGLEWRYAANDWPSRGSIIIHKWLSSDGPMATSDDVFHIGAYTLIDPLKFRTVGFKSTQAVIGVMPLDYDPLYENSNFLSDDFPNSGQVDIDDLVYDYLGKYTYFTGESGYEIMGPFQLRNITSWSDPFNKDPDGSHNYQGGRAIEFTQFRWLVGDDHAADYLDSIVGTSAGYSWTNQETMWKVWITTGGQMVLLRNRARYYSTSMPDYYPSGDEKVYVTNGLTGVSPADPSDEYFHAHGTFCYLHQNDEAKLLGFLGSNMDHDLSITSLLEKFCAIAGTQAFFPGDVVFDAVGLTDGQEQAVNE